MKTFANLKNIRIWLIMLFVFLGMDAMAQNITGTVKRSFGFFYMPTFVFFIRNLYWFSILTMTLLIAMTAVTHPVVFRCDVFSCCKEIFHNLILWLAGFMAAVFVYLVCIDPGRGVLTCSVQV